MSKQKGFTFISVISALAISAVLVAWGIGAFPNAGIDCKNPNVRPGFIMRAKIANVVGSLGVVHLKVEMFSLSHNRYPVDANELGLGNDPWGNPYVFHKFTTVGKARKDHNLVRVNGPYDVYSMGPDGKTTTPFTSALGGDDIVIANNGSYIGVACYHYTGKGKS